MAEADVRTHRPRVGPNLTSHICHAACSETQVSVQKKDANLMGHPAITVRCCFGLVLAHLQDLWHHLSFFLEVKHEQRSIAGLRGAERAASKPGAPFLPCTTFEAVLSGEKLSYRIPLVPNARRFRAGHKLRLSLTTDDQNPATPAMLEFRHASVGTSSFNTIFPSSRLL